jgi:hypothetical protein
VEDTERILSSEEILQCDKAQRGVHVAGISKFFTQYRQYVTAFKGVDGRLDERG